MWEFWRVIATARWFFSSMTPGFIAAGILFFILLPFRRRRLVRRGLAGGPLRECGMFLLWVFAGGMAAITLVPEPGWLTYGLAKGIWLPYFDTDNLGRRLNLIPFAMRDNLFNIAGNIVMLVPFGFLAALLWRKFDWKRALMLGVGITCCVECWQIFLGRYFDIDDIILNTLGVFCGYLLWALLDKLAPQFTKKFHVNEEAA